jgi:hypothetical protein
VDRLRGRLQLVTRALSQLIRCLDVAPLRRSDWRT